MPLDCYHSECWLSRQAQPFIFNSNIFTLDGNDFLLCMEESFVCFLASSVANACKAGGRDYIYKIHAEPLAIQVEVLPMMTLFKNRKLLEGFDGYGICQNINQTFFGRHVSHLS